MGVILYLRKFCRVGCGYEKVVSTFNLFYKYCCSCYCNHCCYLRLVVTIVFIKQHELDLNR